MSNFTDFSRHIPCVGLHNWKNYLHSFSEIFPMKDPTLPACVPGETPALPEHLADCLLTVHPNLMLSIATTQQLSKFFPYCPKEDAVDPPELASWQKLFQEYSYIELNNQLLLSLDESLLTQNFKAAHAINNIAQNFFKQELEIFWSLFYQVCAEEIENPKTSWYRKDILFECICKIDTLENCNLPHMEGSFSGDPRFYSLKKTLSESTGKSMPKSQPSHLAPMEVTEGTSSLKRPAENQAHNSQARARTGDS